MTLSLLVGHVLLVLVHVALVSYNVGAMQSIHDFIMKKTVYGPW